MGDADQRQHKRFELDGLELKCNMFFKSDVTLVNISMGGAAIRLTRRLSMGRPYTLSLRGPTETIQVRGTVMWEKLVGSHAEENGDVVPEYELGIAFDDVFTSSGSALLGMLDKWAATLDAPLRTRGVRLSVSSTRTRLDFHEDYSIQAISMGGMHVMTHAHMPENQFAPMEVTLPDQERAVHVMGRIVSSQQASAPGEESLWRTGIEFVQIEEEDRAMLERFIRRYGRNGGDGQTVVLDEKPAD